uniref:hypothetical protein n=1 Tax=Thaumasiovibrio occultus TaxID=1891184 RepID=UPI000B352713|nr:hypothetical protein [Thaumasiovibrio occultus]
MLNLNEKLIAIMTLLGVIVLFLGRVCAAIDPGATLAQLSGTAGALIITLGVGLYSLGHQQGCAA